MHCTWDAQRTREFRFVMYLINYPYAKQNPFPFGVGAIKAEAQPCSASCAHIAHNSHVARRVTETCMYINGVFVCVCVLLRCRALCKMHGRHARFALCKTHYTGKRAHERAFQTNQIKHSPSHLHSQATTCRISNSMQHEQASRNGCLGTKVPLRVVCTSSDSPST